MDKKSASEKVSGYMRQRVTRRQAIKAGGIAAAGFVFAKPVIETLRPSPAWAQVSPITPTPTPSTPQLDQSNLLAGPGGGILREPPFLFAQTLTAGITGTLHGINLIVSDLSGSANMTVEFRGVTGGEPNATILGTTTIPAQTAITDLITFPGVINIVAGVQYAIVIYSAGSGDINNGWAFAFNSTNYGPGEGHTSTDNGATWGNNGGDFVFQTFVLP